jgi:putative polyketide hydroxylase
MSGTSEQVSVLIVGAGAAGLAAAIDLADRGLAPVVVERRAGPANHPRATALTAGTMAQMARWGIEAEVRRLGFASRHAMSIRQSLTGPEIHCVPFDDHAWTCAQDHLEAALARRARAAGAEIRYGVTLASLYPAAGGMLATVTGPDGHQPTIEAQYVIGADGARSTVRQYCGITTGRASDFGHWLSILFHAPLREHISGAPFMVYRIENPASGGGVLVPTDATTRWIHGLAWDPEQGERTEDFTSHRCAELIRAAAGIPDLPVEIIDVRTFHMTAALADTYRAGRAILVGDAAHVFPPTSGMGLNLALHDATVAARILASTIVDGDEPSALDEYEQACRPLAEQLLAPDLAAT